jgi:uncharacterized membrane protein YdbT with pleckstrin-like domain
MIMDSHYKPVGLAAFYYRLVAYIPAAVLVGIIPWLLIMIGSSGSMVSIAFGILIVCIFVSIIIAAIRAFLQWKHLGYKIESGALHIYAGELSIGESVLLFAKITSSTIGQSFLQRIMGVANLSLEVQDNEDEYGLDSIDLKSAQEINKAVSGKSNVQPVMIK